MVPSTWGVSTAQLEKERSRGLCWRGDPHDPRVCRGGEGKDGTGRDPLLGLANHEKEGPLGEKVVWLCPAGWCKRLSRNDGYALNLGFRCLADVDVIPSEVRHR